MPSYAAGSWCSPVMAHAVVVDPSVRVGVVVLTGHVTGGDMARARRALVDVPEWEPGFRLVWDLTGADVVDVSPPGFDQFVASARELHDRVGTGRVAFVTRRETVGVLVQLFGLLTADLGRTYTCVPTRAEAAEWLGVPLPVAG